MNVVGYTVEVKTYRWGTWLVTDIVFGTKEEAAEYVHELDGQWPNLMSEWRTIETLKSPTHTWDSTTGLTSIGPLERVIERWPDPGDSER